MSSQVRADPPTLFADDLAGRAEGERLRPAYAETEHLRLRRCRPGVLVHVTDGRCTRRSAELTTLARTSTEVTLASLVPVGPCLAVRLAVGIGGSRARTLTLVEKAVEFGTAHSASGTGTVAVRRGCRAICRVLVENQNPRHSGAQAKRRLVAAAVGLTDREKELCAASGCAPALLSSRVPRYETAALAALAVVSQRALQSEAN